MVSNFLFTRLELAIFPMSMLLFTFVFSNKFGVWSAFFFLILFILIGVIKEKGFELTNVFFALYALLMNSFLGYIVAAPLEYLFSWIGFVPVEFLYLTVAVMPPIINYLLMKSINHFFPDFTIHSLMGIPSFSLSILIVILSTVMGLLYMVLTIENRTGKVRWQSNLLILFLFLVVVFSLLVLNINFQRQRKKEVQTLKDDQLLQLQEYTNYVESLYDELNQFKHDYINILTSLDNGIRNKDLKAIQQVYVSVIEPTKQSFQTNHFMIARLSNIHIPEIKSLISAKLMIARQNNIDIQVEVVEPIESINTDLLDLIRVISILLDNAIEAALETEKPRVRTAIIKEENKIVIVIENSISEIVNIRRISEKGYSTKGTGRGIGLYTVQNILKKDDGLFLETSSEHQVFSQVLRIVGDST